MLTFEFFILFFLLPTIVYWGRFRVPALPLLWVLAGYCAWVLWRHGRTGDTAVLPDGTSRWLPSILIPFLIFAAIATAATYRWARRDLFTLVRKRPALWAVVMVGYPVLSVYPQGIVFRAFFFDRYRAVFPGAWLLILMSAVAFTYIHIIFRNWIAVALSALGGLLFAARYVETGSLFVSCVEHALYGCWLFTVGLGRWFFYQGQFKDEPRVS